MQRILYIFLHAPVIEEAPRSGRDRGSGKQREGGPVAEEGRTRENLGEWVRKLVEGGDGFEGDAAGANVMHAKMHTPVDVFGAAIKGGAPGEFDGRFGVLMKGGRGKISKRGKFGEEAMEVEGLLDP